MSPTTKGRVRIVCVGHGYWGPNIVRNLLELEQAQVLGFCRADPAKLQAMRDDYPWARLYRDMPAVLADPDVEAVTIATPAPTHFALARDALAAGKHVFVEKPMTLEVGEAEELVALAEQQTRVLMVGHLLEYSAPVQAIKRVLDSGAIGPVRHVHMERLKLGKVRTEENVLWSFAPHDISVVGFLLGRDARPLSVRATGHRCLQPDVEDIVHLDLEYPGGVQVHIHVSWLHPEPRRCAVIVGGRGMLVWDDLAAGHKVLLHRKHIDLDGLSAVDGGAEPVPAGGEEPLRAECRHFLDCILTGATPISDGRDGLRVVEVLAKATAALSR